ncbi:MAG: class I SAM-dependent methyltransferase [Pirellulaceae bacterium]
MSDSADLYTGGGYLENNPTWHLEDSPFKAKYIHQIIAANKLSPQTIAEIGCGAGGVLHELGKLLPSPEIRFSGFDVSADAIEMAQQFVNERTSFEAINLFDAPQQFDLLMAIDVFEHVPDYLGFISGCARLAKYKLFHVPLDIHVSSVLRGTVGSARANVGHLHYFTSETALDTIRGCGMNIVDSLFTPTAIELYRMHPSLKRAIANMPRWLVSKINKRIAARWFGGYSLLILAE